MHGLLILEDNTKFNIRLDAKPVTDTHMVYETWGRHDYNPEGFGIKDTAYVIDIGAPFTAFAAKQAPHGQVFAFEPFPENFQLLQDNVTLNNLKNVQMFNLGVGGRSKEVQLYLDETNNAGHSMFKVTNNAITIKLVSLDSIFEDNSLKRCSFLKIDCEGAEYEILFNASNATLAKISMVAMEYHDGMYREKNVKDMIKLLSANGFTVKLSTPKASQGLLYAKKKL
ncbi:MAG TPA: FkbM family methyltransferase [Candidatus Saccharimonadales bacterium]|nr:FkbM family methyltransferase [Candidatus Saccharimonadales bacterium]